jgi:hypothetical protein
MLIYLISVDFHSSIHFVVLLAVFRAANLWVALHLCEDGYRGCMAG